jgi:prepilin-type N-terminal cleavage/methylation domain-containing protein
MKRRAFTLIEIMIVTAITGLLAALALPYMLSAGERSRNARFARDIQAAASAFLQYALDNGAYPPDSTPGVLPNGMAAYLGTFPWSEDTSIGGQWDWDYQQFGIYAGVSVYQPKLDRDGMLKIDKLFDDGHLGTGNFRSRQDGYIFIIEETNATHSPTP